MHMINVMKRVLAVASTLIYLLTGGLIYAATPATSKTPEFSVGIVAPAQGIDPQTRLGTIISNVLTIVFSVAALMVLIMLIIGAFNWITSGGEKEKIGKARDRIINALIGLALLALAFLIVRVVGTLLNIDLLNLALPALGPAAAPTTTINNPI
jgi:hypothetical protein